MHARGHVNVYSSVGSCCATVPTRAETKTTVQAGRNRTQTSCCAVDNCWGRPAYAAGPATGRHSSSMLLPTLSLVED